MTTPVQTCSYAYEAYPDCLETSEGCAPDSPTTDLPADSWSNSSYAYEAYPECLETSEGCAPDSPTIYLLIHGVKVSAWNLDKHILLCGLL